MDSELISDFKARLSLSRMEEFSKEPSVIDYGAIVSTKSGQVDMMVNFKTWHLEAGSVIILFPGDVVSTKASGDFLADVLSYDPAMLREASLQMEHAVYSQLREDRCRGDEPIVSDLVGSMFRLLHVYFSQSENRYADQIVLCQLKAFFLGFCDFIERHPEKGIDRMASHRVNELFNEFMSLVAEHYRDSRDVNYYADQMNISPKYLGQIVQQKTQHSPKVIIDHYVVMQLKLLLRTSRESVKQIAWQYHFNDTSFFCRYFKLRAGISPQQYRELQPSDAGFRESIEPSRGSPSGAGNKRR